MSTPEEIMELLGAYALDAVDPAEREAVEQYLATHPRERAEVAEHQEVATFLAFTGARAPDGLWDRIASSLDEPAPAVGPELAKVMPMAAPRQRRRRFPVLLAAVGAAAAAIIVALGLVVVSQRDEINDREVALEAGYQDAVDEPGSQQVTIASEDGSVSVDAVVTPGGDGFLQAAGLPALAEDESYQLWAIVGDNAPVSLGVLGNDPGLVAFRTDTPDGILAISTEGRGGSVQPTTVVAVGQPA